MVFSVRNCLVSGPVSRSSSLASVLRGPSEHKDDNRNIARPLSRQPCFGLRVNFLRLISIQEKFWNAACEGTASE